MLRLRAIKLLMDGALATIHEYEGSNRTQIGTDESTDDAIDDVYEALWSLGVTDEEFEAVKLLEDI